MSYLNTDNPGYLKDPSSGFIINMNDDQYMRILADREKSKEQIKMCQKMKNLESELTEIKTLLLQVLNKG